MQTALFDTVAAMLAALAIMPAVFSFDIDPVSGPSLMFLTLPEVFKQMPLGNFCPILLYFSSLCRNHKLDQHVRSCV